MGNDASSPIDLGFQPLTPKRWRDFETLFGPNGACGGCWCMWWRLTASEFNKRKGDENREAMREFVESGHVPGILVYDEKRPVGWCSIAPREYFPRLDRSPTLKRIDDTPVWSVVCFFVGKGHRYRGVTERLLRAAVEYARREGAQVVEGYPVEPGEKRYPDFGAWTGFASTFRKAGFQEVLRRREKRPIMRYRLGEARKT